MRKAGIIFIATFASTLIAAPSIQWTGTMSATAAPDTWHDHYAPYHAFNGDGLDATGLLHRNDFDTDTWQTNAGSVIAHPGGVAGKAWIKADFGIIYNIEKMWVWNLACPGYSGRGLRKATIEYSVDGSTWTVLAGWTNTLTGLQEFGRSAEINNYPHETEINFGVLARYVIITANAADGSWGMDPLGVAEIRFFGVSAGATNPSPVSGAVGVADNPMLNWTAGSGALSHDVYFGTSQAAVQSATHASPEFKGNQAGTSYPIAGLLSNTTYYWRIDEIDGASNVCKGTLWSFTVIGTIIPQVNITATASGAIDSAHTIINTINGSGLSGLEHDNDHVNMWLDNASGSSSNHPFGLGCKSWAKYSFDRIYKLGTLNIWNCNQGSYTARGLRAIRIDCSTNGTTYTNLASFELPQAPGTAGYLPYAVSCNAVQAKYVVITATSNWGETYYGLSEVQFGLAQSKAGDPGPANGGTGVPNSGTILTWTAGTGSAWHNVYFGTDYNEVLAAAPLWGDVDRNGIVDFKDIGLFARAWLTSPSAYAGSDVNHNGKVEFLDFALFAESWNHPSVFKAMIPEPTRSFDPGTLLLGRTYYWRVDEVNDSTIVKGDVWSFTVENGLHVFCGVGDHLWESSLEPVDSPATISAMFEWMYKTYKVDRIYWRSTKLWDETYKVGDLSMASYDWAKSWMHHLYQDVGIDQAAISAAHSNGQEIFFYTGLFEHGVQPDVGVICPYLFEDQLRIDHPEWCELDRWGQRRCPGPLSFCYPQVRNVLVQQYVDHVVQNGYDGINFYTYVENLGIRYLDEFGFNQPIVDEFNKVYPGVDLRTAALTTDQKLCWYRCRGKFVTDFVRQLHTALASAGKKLSIIIDSKNPNYPQPWWGRSMPGTGNLYMDWESWVDEGIVDELWVQFGATADQQALLSTMLARCAGKPVKLTFRTDKPFDAAWDQYVQAGIIPTAVITSPTNGIERVTLEPTSLATLQSPDWRLRVQTLSDIAAGTIAADGATVAALANDPNVLVRREVMQTLAALNSQVSVLEQGLSDPESSVRIAAGNALAKVFGANSTTMILAALRQDGYFQMKNACISALGTIASSGGATGTNALNAVIAGMQDPNETIREVCAQALYQAGRAGLQSQVYQPLYNALINTFEDERVRYWAIYGLIGLRVNFTSTQQQQIVNALISVIGNEPSTSVELNAADGLGYMVSYMTTDQFWAAWNKLRNLFAAYGDGCTRSDAAYGWRVVGNALAAFGSEGVWALQNFLSQQTAITATANSYTHPHYMPTLSVNGSGLDSNGLLHRNDLYENVWLTFSGYSANPGTVYGSTWIRYDLKSIYTLDSMWVWNIAYPGYTGRGLRNVTIQYSTTGGSDPSEWATAWTGQFNRSLGTDNYAHETEVNLGGISAKYIVITSSMSNGNWGQEPMGLAEVRFLSGTQPILPKDKWLAWLAYQVLYEVQTNTGDFNVVDQATAVQNHNSYAPEFPGYRSW